MKRLWDWFNTGKWHPVEEKLYQDYHACFSTPHGQRVLRHMIDAIYCSVYEGTDPMQLATHNGRRSVVHEILELLQRAEQPTPPEPRIEDDDGR